MRRIIIDIETDSIDASSIWCVVCKEIYGDLKVFRNKEKFNSYILQDDVFIAHNGITFDIPLLRKLWNSDIQNVEDTLIMSRLYNPEREGGHSLEAWGNKLG